MGAWLSLYSLICLQVALWKVLPCQTTAAVSCKHFFFTMRCPEPDLLRPFLNWGKVLEVQKNKALLGPRNRFSQLFWICILDAFIFLRFSYSHCWINNHIDGEQISIRILLAPSRYQGIADVKAWLRIPNIDQFHYVLLIRSKFVSIPAGLFTK